MPPQEAPQHRNESTLAWARLGLATVALIGLQFTANPQSQSGVLQFIPYGFVIYAVTLLGYSYSGKTVLSPVTASVIDLCWAILIALISFGAHGSFFAFALFPAIVAGMHYGMKGSLAAAIVQTVLLAVLQLAFPRSFAIPLDSFVIQMAYLFVFAATWGCLWQRATTWREEINSLTQQMVAKATQQERQRISGELHDRVLQLLATMRLRAESCRTSLIGKPRELERELETIEKASDDAIADIRRLLADTQSQGDLIAGSLERRLREELEIFRSRIGLRLKFRCDVKGYSLPYRVERELYFALREGVLNAVRHSRASEIALTLSQDGGTCQAVLKDNGIGFDLSSIEGGTHYGLRGMRERIERAGGHLSIRTAPGQGTEITIVIPINP